MFDDTCQASATAPPYRRDARRWGRPSAPAETLPAWGTAHHFTGLSVHYCELNDFELNMVVPRHIIEFECSPNSSTVRINGDAPRRVDFTESSTSFIAGGSEAFRNTRIRRDDAGRQRFVAIAFDDRLVEAALGPLSDGRAVSFIDRAAPVDDLMMRQAGTALKAAMTSASAGVEPMLIEALAHHFITLAALRWSTLGGRHNIAPTQADGDTIAQAREFIHARLTTSITLAEIAAHCGVSVDMLVRRFKTTLGQTPYDYVQKERVERAKQRLRCSPVSMLSLSNELGFKSQSHFSTAFKNVTGVSPSHYRRAVASS